MGDDSAALHRFREEHAQVFATLWRRLGEFDLVDAALTDAYLAAQASWDDAMPHNPATWMATVALSATTGVVSRRALDGHEPAEPVEDLRALLWTCCHPDLSPEARVACLVRAGVGFLPGAIADMLGEPERDVQARLDAAKKLFRRVHRAAVADDERAARTALVEDAIASVRAATGPGSLEAAELLDAARSRALA